MTKARVAGMGLVCALALTARALASGRSAIVVFAAASDRPAEVVGAIARGLAARIDDTPGIRGIALDHGALTPGATAARAGASEYLTVAVHVFEDGAEVAFITPFSASGDRQLGPALRVRLDEDALPDRIDLATVLPATEPAPPAAAPPAPRPLAAPLDAPAVKPAPAANPAPAPAPTAKPVTPLPPATNPAPVLKPAPSPTLEIAPPTARPAPVPAAKPVPAASAAPQPVATAALAPCALNPQFLGFHRSILEASALAQEAGDAAGGRGSAPAAKRSLTVERDGARVEEIAAATLEPLAVVSRGLQSAPEGTAKDTAFQLGTFYASALVEVRDYARAAIVYERTLYGTPSDATAAAPAMTFDDARKLLELQAAAAGDTSRELSRPEYYYAAACSLGVSAPRS